MESSVKEEGKKRSISTPRAVMNFSSEEDDIKDPAWNRVKYLSTDEERYGHVRDHWQSKTTPNPNKNLTYHSFRKRHLNIPARVIKQCKRKITGCEESSAKRHCTSFIDEKITSIIKEKELKTKSLIDEMSTQITSSVNKLRFVETYLLENRSVHINKNSSENEYSKYLSMFEKIWSQTQFEIFEITHQCKQKAKKYDSRALFEICDMNAIRHEVIQFNSFYGRLGLAKERDPTVLTDQQLREMDEIENIFEQFDYYYKNP